MKRNEWNSAEKANFLDESFYNRRFVNADIWLLEGREFLLNLTVCLSWKSLPLIITKREKKNEHLVSNKEWVNKACWLKSAFWTRFSIIALKVCNSQNLAAILLQYQQGFTVFLCRYYDKDKMSPSRTPCCYVTTERGLSLVSWQCKLSSSASALQWVFVTPSWKT